LNEEQLREIQFEQTHAVGPVQAEGSGIEAGSQEDDLAMSRAAHAATR
jgi:hypothetical protein